MQTQLVTNVEQLDMAEEGTEGALGLMPELQHQTILQL